MSLFSAVEMAPRDPILGLNEAFNADTRTTKVNLGVGVYCNEEGEFHFCAPLSKPKRSASLNTLRAVTCRSMASLPTTRPCKSCCSVTIRR